jgi:hypothetical protein
MSDPRFGRAFWIALPVGAGVMVYGAIGLVTDSGLPGAFDVARWLVGADLANDAVLAPLACLVGAGIARLLPRWCRAPVQAGLLASGVLLIVAFPALRGFGRDQVPDNETVQPLDYSTGTLTALAVVWSAVAVWLVVRFASAARETRRPPTRATPDGHPTSPR